MKPIVVLTLFLLCTLTNVMAADLHVGEAGHSDSTERHIHLAEHHHGVAHEEAEQQDTDHDQEHNDVHVHLCWHFLPWEDADLSFDTPLATRIGEGFHNYLGVIDTPPVPPPTV